MKEENIEIVKKAEEKFKQDWKNKDWTGIWYDLEFVISNIVKKESGHHKRPDFQEIVDLVTINQFNRLKNHVKKNPDYEVKTTLSTFVYLPVYYEIHSMKRKFLEEIYFADWLEEKADA